MICHCLPCYKKLISTILFEQKKKKYIHANKETMQYPLMEVEERSGRNRYVQLRPKSEKKKLRNVVNSSIFV